VVKSVAATERDPVCHIESASRHPAGKHVADPIQRAPESFTGVRADTYGDPTRGCRCTPAIIQRYLGKISGPLIDRIYIQIDIQIDIQIYIQIYIQIDIQIEVLAVPFNELRDGEMAESSSAMLARVEKARSMVRFRAPVVATIRGCPCG
jgi:hypothetical protein